MDEDSSQHTLVTSELRCVIRLFGCRPLAPKSTWESRSSLALDERRLSREARAALFLSLRPGMLGVFSTRQPVSLWPAALNAALALSRRLPCPVLAHALHRV